MTFIRHYWQLWFHMQTESRYFLKCLFLHRYYHWIMYFLMTRKTDVLYLWSCETKRYYVNKMKWFRFTSEATAVGRLTLGLLKMLGIFAKIHAEENLPLADTYYSILLENFWVVWWIYKYTKEFAKCSTKFALFSNLKIIHLTLIKTAFITDSIYYL